MKLSLNLGEVIKEIRINIAVLKKANKPYNEHVKNTLNKKYENT